MMRRVSRILSLVVVAVSAWQAWNVELGLWYVVLGVIPVLLFIWFPEEIEEFTFGSWLYGYQIDSHTPAVLIALVGWVLLFLSVYVLFDPGLVARLFGMLH